MITLTLALCSSGQELPATSLPQHVTPRPQPVAASPFVPEEVITFRNPCVDYQDALAEKIAAPLDLSRQERRQILSKLPDRRMAKAIDKLLTERVLPCEQCDIAPSLPRNCFETVAAALGNPLRSEATTDSACEPDWYGDELQKLLYSSGYTKVLEFSPYKRQMLDDTCSCLIDVEPERIPRSLRAGDVLLFGTNVTADVPYVDYTHAAIVVEAYPRSDIYFIFQRRALGCGDEIPYAIYSLGNHFRLGLGTFAPSEAWGDTVFVYRKTTRH